MIEKNTPELGKSNSYTPCSNRDPGVVVSCQSEVYWYGCYRNSFNLIASESFAHPAKMAPALCFKIVEHLKELGLLKEGDTVLDPMAGTGMTNICAGAMGYPSISVELEEKFVGFQKQNKQYAERKLYKALDWQMIQGDSRKLSELLKGKELVSVTSPPYQEAQQGGGGKVNRNTQVVRHSYAVRSSPQEITYGTTAGQIGNLKDVPLKAITSPPYTESTHHSDDPAGDSENNIGQLPDKPLKSVMSPPYDGNPSASNSDLHPERQQSTPAGRQYGESEGQIGKEQSESYLSAMLQVYKEIAKVSDVLAVVIKNPTRNGKLRRLDLDTIKILELAGWRVHCQHRALLFEELEQGDLFGGGKKQVKGRLSFFKRLSWQKGSPVASWEDVIICTRN